MLAVGLELRHWMEHLAPQLDVVQEAVFTKKAPKYPQLTQEAK